MSRWVAVARVDEVPPGEGREVVAEDRIVALFNVDGTFYALDGVCPHQGGPLGQGQLCGTVVTCPWHGWQFDVRTGQHQINPTIVHITLPVKVEGDQVLVDIESDS